jgi:outer membrane protein
MKKIILTVAAVFALTFANAQDKKEGSAGFGKGDLYLTGTAGFSTEKTGDAKGNTLTLSPGLGYFLTENLALEGNLNITSGTTNAGGGASDVKNTGFGLAAGVKYFWTPASQFSLSVGGMVSYMSDKTDNGVTSATGKTIGLNVPVGLNYFVSSNFALTSSWGGLGYSSNDNGGNGADKTDKISLGLDMSSIKFGLLYKL